MYIFIEQIPKFSWFLVYLQVFGLSANDCFYFSKCEFLPSLVRAESHLCHGLSLLDMWRPLGVQGGIYKEEGCLYLQLLILLILPAG